MRILNNEGFTFDDLLIVPQYSRIDSRGDVDISVQLGNMKLKIPVIAANMDTICEYEMALAMGNLGGLGILHRFAPISEQLQWVNKLLDKGVYAVPSIGVGADAFDNAKNWAKAKATAICIDIAHGNSKKVFDLAWKIYQELGINLIVGNFATNLEFYNANPHGLPPNVIAIKTGVGPGSGCTTRVVAGVGVPQATAIIETSINNTVIADGGIRKPADAAKAIGLGASAIMVGGYLAGTDEVPLRGKTSFRGMASGDAQLEHRGNVSNGVAEGASFSVESQGPVVHKINELVGGIRSAMSYTGVNNIQDFQNRVVFQRVSQATVSENIPHFGEKK